MRKLFLLSLFGFLFLNVSTVVMADDAAQPAKSPETPVSEVSAEDKTPTEADFNFNDSSYYLTDEQLQEAKEVDDIDDKSAGFLQKIINSSHFSSGTATKTYIPINKVQ